MGGEVPKVLRPVWVAGLGLCEGLCVGCDGGGVVDPELQGNFARVEEAAVILAVDGVADDTAEEGAKPGRLRVLPPCSLSDVARATEHVAAVNAARGSVAMEELASSVEDDLHRFAIGVDSLPGHGSEFSMVVPGNVGQSCAESGIDNGWRKRGENGGLVAAKIGRNHASVRLADVARTVGFGPVFGLEVDVCDRGQEPEDAKGGLVAGCFRFRGGAFVVSGKGPAVHIGTVAYGRFDLHGRELL